MEQHSHPDCCLTREETGLIVENMIEQLRETGMRKTDALEELLLAMLQTHKPYLLVELCELPGLESRDQATIYRLVTKLKDCGLIRQLNFGEKRAYFQLNVEGHHHDYLLCDKCGEISEVPYPCALGEVEARLREDHGWSQLSHSLAFHGICPDCNGTSTHKPASP